MRLADVARVEIGQESYGGDSRFSGQNATGFGVNLATGANAVDTAAAVELEADRDLLLQAVSVFVSNAVVHTPVSSTVSLAARVDGNSLVIGVTDSGLGIAQEHLGRLFDRFYRVDPGRARTQGGSGLGLAIARSIAEAHGGTVAVASTVGVGSTFQLRLPLSAA